MKHWIALSVIVLLGVAAVLVSERRKVDVPASPAALLYLIADTEQELTRMPVSFTRMPDEEEIRIGNGLARYYATREERENTPETTVIDRYLTQVGMQLARHAHRRLPYKFHYIPSSYMVNAFALPGGHVYVGGGLLALMDSEDELAAVIGHEIEHIDHFHCAERVQREQAMRKLPLGGLVALPIELFEAGYSKDQEMEADREGTRLAVEAGYSANGAIRMFETFRRLYQEYQVKARTPQEELSQVAVQTLEGYFRSHPLPSERIAQVQKLIASEGWTVRPERDLAVAYIFWTARAQRALATHKYAQAEQWATRSLQMQPAQEHALQVLAEAQFAQANFAGAAAAYRKLLDLRGGSIDIADSYALSLAAADRQSAAGEFRQWMESAKGDTHELQVPMAGVLLLAGDADAAQKAVDSAHANPGREWSPMWLGKLGWWYYVNGDYQTAASLLSEAAQERPGDMKLWVRLAWAQIELRQYSSALQALETTVYERQSQPERAIVRAVARWQAREPDQALQEYAVAVGAHPEWENPAWVKALYSPLVAQSVEEMRAEQNRRREKAKIAAPR